MSIEEDTVFTVSLGKVRAYMTPEHLPPATLCGIFFDIFILLRVETFPSGKSFNKSTTSLKAGLRTSMFTETSISSLKPKKMYGLCHGSLYLNASV